MNHEQTAEILNQAADDLEEYGWCKHVYFATPNTSTSRACSLGAIARAENLEATMGLASSLCSSSVAVALRAVINVTSVGDIGQWNDAEERTQAEVLDAFRLAAKNELRLADAE